MEWSEIMVLGGVAAFCGFVGAVLAATHRGRYMVQLMVALYVTAALFGAMPQKWHIDATQTLWLFVAAVGGVVFTVPLAVHGTQKWSQRHVPWRSMLFSIAVGGMAVSMFLPLLMDAGIVVPFFSQDIVRFFTVAPAQFLWMFAPLSAIIVLRRV